MAPTPINGKAFVIDANIAVAIASREAGRDVETIDGINHSI